MLRIQHLCMGPLRSDDSPWCCIDLTAKMQMSGPRYPGLYGAGMRWMTVKLLLERGAGTECQYFQDGQTLLSMAAGQVKTDMMGLSSCCLRRVLRPSLKILHMCV